MPVEVHQEYVKRRFVAPCCSVACGLNVLIIAGAAILPLYIAWASHSLWIREALQWEQPRVTYRNALVFSAQGWRGAAGSAAVPFERLWTTSPTANALLGADVVNAPLLQSFTTDNNLDGVADALHVSVKMPLASDEVVTSAMLLAAVDVDLVTATRLHMDAWVVGAYAGGVPGSGLTLDGDLAFIQRAPVPSPPYGGVFTPYQGASIVDLDAARSASDVTPAAILAAMRDRNLTLAFSVPQPAWAVESGYAPVSPASASLAATSRVFTVDVTVRIAPTAIRVRPGVAEELKHGWIQYVSFLVVTIVAAWFLRVLLFGFRLVETATYVDAPRTNVKAHVE